MVLTSGTPCKDLRHPRGSPVYAVRKAAPDQGKPNSVGCGVSWRGGGDMQDGHQHVLALFNSHHTCPQDPRPPTGKGALEKNPAVILEAIHFVLLKLF